MKIAMNYWHVKMRNNIACRCRKFPRKWKLAESVFNDVLKLCVHSIGAYFRYWILFIWENIEEWLALTSVPSRKTEMDAMERKGSRAHINNRLHTIFRIPMNYPCRLRSPPDIAFYTNYHPGIAFKRYGILNLYYECWATFISQYIARNWIYSSAEHIFYVVPFADCGSCVCDVRWRQFGWHSPTTYLYNNNNQFVIKFALSHVKMAGEPEIYCDATTQRNNARWHDIPNDINKYEKNVTDFSLCHIWVQSGSMTLRFPGLVGCGRSWTNEPTNEENIMMKDSLEEFQISTVKNFCTRMRVVPRIREPFFHRRRSCATRGVCCVHYMMRHAIT